MKLQRHSTKGFTLVEIMIVVVIIGLLAAMAIPAFQKVRRQSYAKAMQNDARLIGSACQQILMAAPPGVFNNGLISLNYNNVTGRIACDVVDPLTNQDYLSQLCSQVGKAYTISGNFNGVADPTTNAFTMSHGRVVPREMMGSNSYSNTEGATMGFNSEGKPL